MLVAILADIHANAAALEAVLADARAHRPDLVVFGGDLAVNGPRPAEALEQVMALGAPSIMGNMDDAVIRAENNITRWARDKISAPGQDYLRGLPFSHRVTPPGGRSPEDDLLVVHATPRSIDEALLLRIPAVGTSFSAPTPMPEAAAMLAGARANRIVYGHIHFYSDGVIAGQRVTSVGSVGFPFDGDPRAEYALARWDGQTWLFEPRRVPYDYEAVAREIESSGMPYPERFAARLRQARWLR